MAVTSLLSSSASAAAASSSAFSAAAVSLSFTSSLAPRSLKLHYRRTYSASLSSRYFASAVSATISVGDKLPDATLFYLDPSTGDKKTVTVSSLTAGKKSILFAVPAAFTSTCSQKHVPGFASKSGELKSKGVDVIACIAVNDAYVMEEWRKNLGIKDEVMLLSDGNCEFTKKIGCELDLSDKPVGLGVRSRRYSLLAEDGVVKVLNLEQGGSLTISGAEDMLKVL